MTITFDLAGPSLSALQAKADRLGVPLDQLARVVVERYAAAESTAPQVMDERTFRRAMADTFRENEELYRRLAK